MSLIWSVPIPPEKQAAQDAYWAERRRWAGEVLREAYARAGNLPPLPHEREGQQRAFERGERQGAAETQRRFVRELYPRAFPQIVWC